MLKKANAKNLIMGTVLVLLLSACSTNLVRGSGDLITKDWQVSDFNQIELEGSGNLVIFQGASESLRVETDDNIMEFVKVDVRGDTLYIGLDTQDGDSISPTKLSYTLGVIDLSGIGISGSGEVKSERIDSDRIEISIDGSGEVAIENLITDELNATILGSGEIILVGEAPVQSALIDGSGNYTAGDFRSERANVELAGSGEATVWATDSLDVQLEGSGAVNYLGSPTVNSSITGSGEVIRIGDK